MVEEAAGLSNASTYCRTYFLSVYLKFTVKWLQLLYTVQYLSTETKENIYVVVELSS